MILMQKITRHDFIIIMSIALKPVAEIYKRATFIRLFSTLSSTSITITPSKQLPKLSNPKINKKYQQGIFNYYSNKIRTNQILTSQQQLNIMDMSSKIINCSQQQIKSYFKCLQRLSDVNDNLKDYSSILDRVHSQLKNYLLQHSISKQDYYYQVSATFFMVRKDNEMWNILVNKIQASLQYFDLSVNQLIELLEHLSQFKDHRQIDPVIRNIARELKQPKQLTLASISHLNITEHYFLFSMFQSGDKNKLFQGYLDFISKSYHPSNFNLNKLMSILNETLSDPKNPLLQILQFKCIQLFCYMNDEYNLLHLYSNKNIDTLSNLLENSDISLLLSYQMSERGKRITDIFKIEKYLPFHDQNPKNLFILLVILHRNKLVDSKGLYNQLIQLITQKYLINIDTFLDTYHKIRETNLPRYIQNIHKILINQFFKNYGFPFSESKNSNLRKNALYMQYFFRVYEYQDKVEFIKRFEVTNQDTLLFEVLKMHLSLEVQNFIPDKYYIWLIITRLEFWVKRQYKKQLEICIKLLKKYYKYGIQRNINQYTEKKVWKLLHLFIKNLGCLNRLNLQTQIYEVIIDFIQFDQKNYRFDVQFKRLIRHLLKKIQVINSALPIFRIIISQGLALNMVQNLKDINIDSGLFTQGSVQSMKLKNIQGNLVQIEEINSQNLESLLINNNCEQYIQKNHQKILSIIKQADRPQIYKYLSAYSLGDRYLVILDSILEQAIAKYHHKHALMQMDINYILDKCKKSGYFNLPKYVKLLQLILSDLKNLIHRLSFMSHLQILKFAQTQPIQNLKSSILFKYIDCLFQRLKQQKAYNNIYMLLNLNCILCDYPRLDARLTKLKLFQTPCKIKSFYGIHLFLLFEQHFNEGQIVKLFTEYTSQSRIYLAANLCKHLIYDLHYSYIKVKYPTLVKHLDIPIQMQKPYWVSAGHFGNYEKILDIISKQIGQSWRYLLEYGSSNKIVKIKSTILIFNSPFKNYSRKQKSLIIEIIRTLHRQAAQILVINFYEPSKYKEDMINNIFINSTLLSTCSKDKINALMAQLQAPIMRNSQQYKELPQQSQLQQQLQPQVQKQDLYEFK